MQKEQKIKKGLKVGIGVVSASNLDFIGRGPNMVQDGLPLAQWSTRPVGADGTEEAVFNGIPITGTTGIIGHDIPQFAGSISKPMRGCCWILPVSRITSRSELG